MRPIRFLYFLILLATGCGEDANKKGPLKQASYADLITLYKDWRTFEQPPLLEGAPDYTREQFEKRWPAFEAMREKLVSMDTSGWPVEQQVDWRIVLAEMNGYVFNHQVLKPWERDPAYYNSIRTERSDVPAHEGPTHHAVVELWTYAFPLDAAGAGKLEKELRFIPAFYQQARKNLVGNAKELWVTGIRDIRAQEKDLISLRDAQGGRAFPSLVKTIEDAIGATRSFVQWLESEAPNKTGPSGVGKEAYTWNLQQVHLVPLTWEDEVMILKRELARAWTGLKLEEHRNRALPELKDADTQAAYDSLAARSARSILRFLQEDSIVTVAEYFEPALKAHLGNFVPKEKRNFFLIGSHIDPRPLYSHFYHWFELARLDLDSHRSPIRRQPLLYNIFDNRNEGLATAVEEMFMQAGLYKDDPRVREIVYIMIAQRAARGLGSLYAHANEMTMEEAGGIHEAYTPRGWMKTEKELRIFEQHLYMRQPGYGSSYITGKYLLEEAMAEMARQRELDNKPFRVKEFLDGLNNAGCIPVALVQWEMTGVDPLQGILVQQPAKLK